MTPRTPPQSPPRTTPLPGGFFLSENQWRGSIEGYFLYLSISMHTEETVAFEEIQHPKTAEMQKNGDRKTRLNQLIETRDAELRKFARGLVPKKPDVADDIYQQALYQIIDLVDRGRDPDTLDVFYFKRAITNALHSKLRREKRLELSLDEPISTEDPRSKTEVLPDTNQANAETQIARLDQEKTSYDAFVKSLKNYQTYTSQRGDAEAENGQKMRQRWCRTSFKQSTWKERLKMRSPDSLVSRNQQSVKS